MMNSSYKIKNSVFRTNTLQHIILLNTSEIKPFEEQNNYLTKLFELFLNQNCIFLRGKSLLKTGSCKEKPPASVTLNT